MSLPGYSENELLANRASLFLFGGSASDRRMWAEQAHAHFADEGPLREVARPADWAGLSGAVRGVVFVPDLVTLGAAGQAEAMRWLLREERPKLVLGLQMSPVDAEARGLLRSDLVYRLRQAWVDLSDDELRAALRARRNVPEGKPRTPRRRAAR